MVLFLQEESQRPELALQLWYNSATQPAAGGCAELPDEWSDESDL